MVAFWQVGVRQVQIIFIKLKIVEFNKNYPRAKHLLLTTEINHLVYYYLDITEF